MQARYGRWLVSTEARYLDWMVVTSVRLSASCRLLEGWASIPSSVPLSMRAYFAERGRAPEALVLLSALAKADGGKLPPFRRTCRLSGARLRGRALLAFHPASWCG
jgi:hypothetical protein